MLKKLKSPEHEAESAHHIDKQPSINTKDDELEDVQDWLAERLREGDRAAAVRLVEMYYPQIFLYMRRLGHDRQESEDLTQESFLNAWYHIGQLKDGKALASWLYRIASNVSRLYWRQHKGKKIVSIEWIDAPEDRIVENNASSEYEQLEALRQAVAQLPIKLKEVVVLHYMQHLTIAEAAKAVGIRQGTFKSRLSRALKTLRKKLP
ncbi:MAG: RNA polymerase sigma factor [Sedimentisphaerales bacterium]|nr:RNA polymerase sigma factor [Sedimentisphaerales bacterium]